MSSKRQIIGFLVSLPMFFVGAVLSQPSMTLPGAGSATPVATIRLASVNQIPEISLLITASQKKCPLLLELLCAPDSDECSAVSGRVAGSTGDFSPSLRLQGIPENGIVKLQLRANLPATDNYDVILRLRDSKGKATEMRLKIARDRPVWDKQTALDNAVTQQVKVGPAGIANIRIIANELMETAPDKLSIRLSEFFDIEDSTPGKVTFVDGTTASKPSSSVLDSVDMSAGIYNAKLDATELKTGRTYRGQLLFDVKESPPPPPVHSVN